MLHVLNTPAGALEALCENLAGVAPWTEGQDSQLQSVGLMVTSDNKQVCAACSSRVVLHQEMWE